LSLTKHTQYQIPPEPRFASPGNYHPRLVPRGVPAWQQGPSDWCCLCQSVCWDYLEPLIVEVLCPSRTATRQRVITEFFLAEYR
jgi:hypothetical protein